MVFGQVTPAGPVAGATMAPTPMYRFQQLDPELMATWAWSFQWRRSFEVAGYVVAGLLALVLLTYTLRGVEGLTHWFHGRTGGRP